MLKVSQSISSAHNRDILYSKKSECSCNCRLKTDVQNDANAEKKFYLGVSQTPFKDRFRNHKKKFVHEKYQNSNQLSKYMW